MADANLVNLCTSALKLTQELRAGVSNLFSKLSNGVDGQKGSSQASEKAFTDDVNKNVTTINKALRLTSCIIVHMHFQTLIFTGGYTCIQLG